MAKRVGRKSGRRGSMSAAHKKAISDGLKAFHARGGRSRSKAKPKYDKHWTDSIQSQADYDKLRPAPSPISKLQARQNADRNSVAHMKGKSLHDIGRAGLRKLAGYGLRSAGRNALARLRGERLK